MARGRTPEPVPPVADESWMREGACRGADASRFFPERGQSVAEQKAICQGCPVQGECLDYALRYKIRFGIWGGTTERQRRRLSRQLLVGAA